ncbi:hypothetical protein BHAP_1540 [Bifidobacterium hapali]|uniref:Antitoxin VbhA domain-containing protein n=1 Tax=Bifidobacterium hapali TaxID=1630172 RepID=A0A261FXB3_9BIFI|nr:hypothetical protein BHAP_1540 [Bifidobacterium hapali]
MTSFSQLSSAQRKTFRERVVAASIHNAEIEGLPSPDSLTNADLEDFINGYINAQELTERGIRRLVVS